MKTIKNLGIKTHEGFEVKNLQRFPSMEWGDEGGMKAEVFYIGKLAFTIYQEGNGGEAITYWTDYGREHLEEIKTDTLEFLKRVDNDYGENGRFDWLKNKTVKDINDDDFESLVNNLEKRYDDIKFAKKQFKKGYHSIAVLDSDYEVKYLSHIGIMADSFVEQYLEQNNLKEQFRNFEIIKYNDLLVSY